MVPRPDPSFLDECERLNLTGLQRWRNLDATRLYEWDGRHGEIEVYNNRGEHLGAADAVTGILVKPPRKGRTIDV